jgi:hypothetical protein
METLETGWVEEFEKNEVRDQLTSVMDVDSIRVNLVRLGSDNRIEGVSALDMCLGKSNFVSKEELIELSERNSVIGGSKFRLTSVVVFNIGIDHESVREFVQKGDKAAGEQCIQASDMVSDIELDPSVHLLHDLNCIYLFFKPPPGVTHACTRRIKFRPGHGKKTRHKRV